MNNFSYNKNNIRNFCIVAHIDHGKSTLADRLLEFTNTVDKRNLSTQTLDNMELEQERGITIKLSPVRMNYNYKGEDYTLNLIDTPGHVDFTYEVSRSLAACDGAIVLVDATQGIEAQTISNIYLAIENNLEIIPVINKIDLPSADIAGVKKQIKEFLGFSEDEIPAVSAKVGTNIKDVLDAVCEKFPAPKGSIDEPLAALIFDSYYDNFKGAVCLVGIKSGKLKAGQKIKMFSHNMEFETTEVGIFKPNPEICDELKTGDIGYICASIKQVKYAKVGDTITTVDNPAKSALPGYKEVMPVVFAGIYPVDGDKFNDLKDALEKLKLSDSSLSFTQESSQALGFGYRCGFLGLLHMEIVTERLEREFNLDLITTAPSVSYKVEKMNGDVIEIANPTLLPSPTEIKCIYEPMVNLNVYTPPEYVGQIMDLASEKRAEYIDMIYQDAKRVKLSYKMPLNEIVFDFFDKLKSRSKGYASLDYELADYQASNLVKVDVLLNNEKCDALSLITHKDKAYSRGSSLALKLKDVIPRQMFEVPIQAAIGGKIIARETVKALRKDVLAKCYGGDISRKRKLLEKQKEGKKKMRMLGSIELPSEAFISILKID